MDIFGGVGIILITGPGTAVAHLPFKVYDPLLDSCTYAWSRFEAICSILAPNFTFRFHIATPNCFSIGETPMQRSFQPFIVVSAASFFSVRLESVVYSWSFPPYRWHGAAQLLQQAVGHCDRGRLLSHRRDVYARFLRRLGSAAGRRPIRIYGRRRPVAVMRRDVIANLWAPVNWIAHVTELQKRDVWCWTDTRWAGGIRYNSRHDGVASV